MEHSNLPLSILHGKVEPCTWLQTSSIPVTHDNDTPKSLLGLCGSNFCLHDIQTRQSMREHHEQSIPSRLLLVAISISSPSLVVPFVILLRPAFHIPVYTRSQTLAVHSNFLISIRSSQYPHLDWAGAVNTFKRPWVVLVG